MFQEFPKCLISGDQSRVVFDEVEEDAARTDGFVFHDEIKPEVAIEDAPKAPSRKPKAD